MSPEWAVASGFALAGCLAVAWVTSYVFFLRQLPLKRAAYSSATSWVVITATWVVLVEPANRLEALLVAIPTVGTCSAVNFWLLWYDFKRAWVADEAMPESYHQLHHSMGARTKYLSKKAAIWTVVAAFYVVIIALISVSGLRPGPLIIVGGALLAFALAKALTALWIPEEYSGEAFPEDP